jgi:hypothetical protein
MSIFGPGVGGGLLAAAGAAQGLGQGIAEVGQQQQKVDLETKMQQLTKDRETALEDMRNQHQTALQASSQTFQAGQEQTRIGAASAAAKASREHESEEEAKNRASREKMNQNTVAGRVEAARLHAESSGAGKGDPKVWESKTLKSTSFDEKNHLPTTGETPYIHNNHTGQDYLQVNDKWIPMDARTGKPFWDYDHLRRPDPAHLQALMQDPLGSAPAGTANAGLSNAQIFQNTYGYLPSAWGAAAHAQVAAQPQQWSKYVTRSSAVPNAGDNPDSSAADNAAQSSDDAANTAPSFKSNSMSTYGAVAGQ